jgi:PAS domain S-box-containing protein
MLEDTIALEHVIEETAIDGMITFNKDNQILSVNPATVELFGYSLAELTERSVIELWNTPDDNSCSDTDKVLTRPTGHRIEIQAITKEGHFFPAELYIGHTTVAGQPLYAATVHDISERKHAEHERHNLMLENRELAHQVLAVQEDERRQLSRELHDEMGQCLAAIRADAETIVGLSNQQELRIRNSANAIIDVSAKIYDTLHSIITRLRPSLLDDLGLVETLRDEITQWQSHHPSIRTKFYVDSPLPVLNDDTNITLYRIVQEGLTNVSKHAHASEVYIKLEVQAQDKTDNCIALTISDNGCGMSQQSYRMGLGLIGMRERAEAAGGHFTLHTDDKTGVSIKISIPLSSRQLDTASE